jgi:tetratricopeptide (TPR) repeat protein
MPRRCYFLLLTVLVGCQSRSETPLADSTPPELPVVAEAFRLLEQGQLETGLERLNAAIERQPDEGRLYGARAAFHHRAGLNPEALADLDRALAAAPDDPRLLNNRGFILLALQRYDEAIRDLERAIEINPQSASARNNRGLVSLARGKYRDAIDWFTKALALQPDYVDALNNRGFAWMQLGRLENAYADLNHALRIAPKYVNALHNRGLLKARAGEREGAVLDFTEAMLLDPQNPKYYEHRGEVYALLGKTEESRADLRMVEWLVALQELNRAVAAEPRHPAAWVRRANHYWAHGDESKAGADVRAALALDPRHGPALVLQARLALADRRYDDVLTATEAALETDEAQSAWSLRGDAFHALGRYDDALECFAHARRFDAAVAEARFRKSQALAAQGDADAAQQQLDLARELDPDVENRLR